MKLRFQQLPILANGREPAEAAECAAAQGKFWEFYDYTFEHWGTDVFGNLNLKRTAETVGMDTREFNRCLDTRRMTDYIQADLEAGLASGINSTPTIVIGEQVFVGLWDYETYREAIVIELERSGVSVN